VKLDIQLLAKTSGMGEKFLYWWLKHKKACWGQEMFNYLISGSIKWSKSDI